MSMLKLLLIPARVTLPGVGAGILTSMALRKYGRPLLVGTVRSTVKLWNEAKEHTEEVRDEARLAAADARLSRPTTTTTKTTSVD